MKWTGTFVAPHLNLAKYRTALRDQLVEQLSLAAFQWLDATAANISQWSGASAATFLHLAREIGYSLPISQSETAPNRESLGLSKGNGEFVLDDARGRYFFTYSTTLEHLIYNEFHNANIVPDPHLFFRLLQPGPYRFQEHGQVAFLRAASSMRLPNPFAAMKRTVIRIK